MDKSLGTLAFLGRFPIYTGPTPPLTLQTKLDACIQNLFRVSTLYRVGEGELQENFEKDALFYEGTQKWQKTVNIAVLSQGLLFMIVIIIRPPWLRLASATQVHELTAELEQLPRRAQVAAGFITYLSSAPEDVRKATMAKWCEAAGLQGFDFRRFMSTESEQLGWKAEGLPSDDLSMENALVILKVTLSVCSCNVQLSVFYLEISSSVW